jgi:hypothetical protein
MAKSKLPVATSSASAKAVPVKIVHDSPMETAKDESRERKWRAEDALKDIERAEGHKRDKALMKDVKACAKEKMKAYGKL